MADSFATRAQLDAQKSTNYPQLEFRASQGLNRNEDGVDGNYRKGLVQLALSYNLFRGGSDTARTRAAGEQLNAAFDLRDKACRDVWQTGEIAANDSQRLAAQIKLLSQHELSTSKARQAYQQQFDIGQRSLLDLLDTENELYQARRALANAEYDLQLSAVRVLASSGTLLGALKLQTLAAESPEASGNAEDEDALMQCDNQVPSVPVLDRSFNSRPATLPVDPGKPVSGATSVVPAAIPPSSALAECSQLPKTVQTWLDAWNKKDVPAYLGAYSSSFVPGNSMDRKQWEAMRASRIRKQGDIQITINQPKPLRCDGKTAEVAFGQEYVSTTYKDSVNKTLELENVKGVWKITRESVTKGRSY